MPTFPGASATDDGGCKADAIAAEGGKRGGGNLAQAVAGKALAARVPPVDGKRPWAAMLPNCNIRDHSRQDELVNSDVDVTSFGQSTNGTAERVVPGSEISRVRGVQPDGRVRRTVNTRSLSTVAVTSPPIDRTRR